MTAPPPSSDEVDATLVSTLDTLDEAANYMRWIMDLVRPHLQGTILEVGAGHGTFTGALAEVGSVHAVEPGAHGGGVLGDRFADDDRVSVVAGVVDDLPEGPSYGSAVMINVLEHIEDDGAALRQIRSRLVPSGRIVIWVPAFPLLYSDFDRKLGHHRRYRRAGLRSVVEAAGFDVVDVRHVNAPGFFAWLLLTRMFGREPTAGRLVTIFDRVVVPVVRRLESLVAPPFGQSLLLVASNPVGRSDDG